MKRTNTATWSDAYKRWTIKVQKDGQRKSFYSSTPGRNGQREANRKADAWLEDNIAARMKCGKALDGFDAEIKERTSHANYDVEHRRIESYIRPLIANQWVDTLNDAALQKIITTYSKKLAKKSLMNLRATLVAFVKYCRRNSLTAYVPDDVTVPKAAQSVGHKILQPEDLRVLFSVDTTVMAGERVPEDYINAFRFQVLTGLRPGELFGLMWTDIIGDYVCLQRAINRDGDITKGKNENAVRSFKLTPSAKKIIDDQPKDSLYVFPVQCIGHYRDHLRHYCEKNGITVVTPYELRHTFISMAKLLPEGLVKSLVGHSRDMDTFGVYGHLFEGEQDMTADKLQDVFQKVIKF